MDYSTPGFPVLHYLLELLKFIATEPVMLSNHLILCHSSPFAFSLSLVSQLFRWTVYWNFGFGISPSNEYSQLISFKIEWFDLLAVQGTLKSVFQHHNLKAPILQC